MDARRRAEWQIAAWFVFLLAFIYVGAVTFDGLWRNARVRDQGPLNSTDAAFARDLHVENAAQQIDRCLAPLPDGATVAVIYRHGSFHTLPAQLLCEMAWMHGLRVVTLTEPEQVGREEMDRAGATAAFSLGTEPPPSLAESQRLGRLLYFWQKADRAP